MSISTMEQAGRDLKARLSDRAVIPSEPGWDEARLAWNLAVDQRPAAVVLAHSTDDVVAAVEVAAQHGLRVAPQSTGHNAGALCSREPLEDSVLVKLTALDDVKVDADAQVARVGAAALWADVQGAAAAHGLAGLSGSAGDVAVAGYSLGGGIGWLGRKHGLAANRIRSLEAVLADGRVVRADATTEPDLLWALRGGGGSFAVVTEIELGLVPVSELYAGVLFFPQERMAEVLNAWRDWTATAPDEATSVGRMLNVPPLEMIPEPVRGKSFVVVEVAYLGDEASGGELIAPLRELGPGMDTFATIPPPGLVGLHMDPPEPVPAQGNGALLREFPAEAVDVVTAAAGPGTHSPLLSFEVRHLGGAIGRPDPDGGALDHIPDQLVWFAVGMAADAEGKAAVNAAVDKVTEAVAPYASGNACLNFTERPVDPATGFGGETWARLRSVKTAYDPEDRIRSNHPVPPA